MGSSSLSGNGEKEMHINIIRESNPLGWISDEEVRQRFLSGSFKTIVTAMSINLDMFKREGFMFPYWLEKQGLSNFVQMKGNWYPDLVKVFYHNLRIENGDIFSKVKGINVHLDDFIWNIMSNLSSEGAYSHLPTTEVNVMLSKKQVYQDWLRFPGVYSTENIFAHEGLLKEEKILAHLLEKIILPSRAKKHRMTTYDIYLLHAIKNSIPTNWLQVEKDHMEYAALRRSLYLPYGCLISKILVLLGVDVSNEQKCIWSSSNAFDRDSLMSLGFVKTMNLWRFMGENFSENLTRKTSVWTTTGTNFFPETNFEKYVAEQIRILHDKFDNLTKMHNANLQLGEERSDEKDSTETF